MPLLGLAAKDWHMSIYFEGGFERIFGTWPMKGAACQQAVEAAIAAGYRAIDTAQLYENEDAVRAGIVASGVPVGELLITTKVHPDNFGEDAFMASVEASLIALGLEAVDVLLLHWPPAGEDVGPSLKLLNQALQRGLAKAVGVSNYTSTMMRKAVEIIDGPVAINQVEFHPLLDQSKLLATSEETGIPLSAYCSIAKGAVFKHPVMNDIAARYGKTEAQVALRWALQKGVAVNTKSATPKNIAANFDVRDFCLSSVDMARIDGIGTAMGRIVDGPRVPWLPKWD